MGPKERGTPIQGDPYEEALSRGLKALVHRQGGQLRSANLL
jgi:hypothetical protein